MLTPELVDNPQAGAEHRFVAYRLQGSEGPRVALRTRQPLIAGSDET
jgi:hypothetical protein